MTPKITRLHLRQQDGVTCELEESSDKNMHAYVRSALSDECSQAKEKIAPNTNPRPAISRRFCLAESASNDWNVKHSAGGQVLRCPPNPAFGMQT